MLEEPEDAKRPKLFWFSLNRFEAFASSRSSPGPQAERRVVLP
jgi:hypothetical protein